MADRFRQILHRDCAMIATNEGKKQYVRADGSFHQTRKISGEATEQMWCTFYRPHYTKGNWDPIRQGWL